MPRCKDIAHFGTTSARQCHRRATRYLPFCWQHGQSVQHAVADLEAYGPDNPRFILQHLTHRDETFEKDLFELRFKDRTLAPTLRLRDRNRDGLSLGALKALPLELL